MPCILPVCLVAFCSFFVFIYCSLSIKKNLLEVQDLDILFLLGFKYIINMHIFLEFLSDLNNSCEWIKGWLPGLKVDGDANQLPTIAIVASYDTFGAAPVCSFLFNFHL